jgi:predicted metal-binding membrane protein
MLALSSLSRRAPLQRGQVALAAALLSLAAAGWAVTDVRMRHMDAGPGTDLGTLGFYVTAWVVMMAAMMFPSILPMTLIYRRVESSRRARGRAGSMSLFVAGYLVSWTAFGLVAYALFDLVKSLSIDELRWNRSGGYLAGGLIVAAGVYQLTPAKDACLSRCRSPFAFVTAEWRDGRLGALQMGALHGGWCVGCCWGLMVALFAVGVMSIGWMVFVSLLIAIEKLLPWPVAANRAVAGVLLVLGLGVALTPSHVPGLTVPASLAANRAMQSMGMPAQRMSAPAMSASRR